MEYGKYFLTVWEGVNGMKKLICVKDVEQAEQRGEKTIFIDKKTIITPAAIDAAKIYGIEFTKARDRCEEKIDCPSTKQENEDKIDGEIIYKALKILMDKGLLNEVLQRLSSTPYISENDGSGLKVVRGNTVKYEKFHTGKPDEKVFFQELTSDDQSSMSTGFLTIDKSSFERKLNNEQINYVIEGTLEVDVNGNKYTAYPGDVVYVPANHNVKWSSPTCVKLFYTSSR